jgi:hypothetical protein
MVFDGHGGIPEGLGRKPNRVSVKGKVKALRFRALAGIPDNARPVGCKKRPDPATEPAMPCVSCISGAGDEETDNDEGDDGSGSSGADTGGGGCGKLNT